MLAGGTIPQMTVPSDSSVRMNSTRVRQVSNLFSYPRLVTTDTVVSESRTCKTNSLFSVVNRESVPDLRHRTATPRERPS